MGIFSRLFGKAQPVIPQEPTPTYAEKLSRILAAFPHRELTQGLPADQVVAAWEAAKAPDITPVLLHCDENLIDMLCDNQWQGDLPANYEQTMAHNIQELLEDEEYKHNIGKMGDKGKEVKPLQTLHWVEKAPLYVVSVPAKHPWDVFRRLPVGGYNACPDAPFTAAFCKEMNEKYGAVPFLISGETLEMKVSRRPADISEAYELALRHYGFCVDTPQEYGTIWRLADTLLKSDYWYFQWD